MRDLVFEGEKVAAQVGVDDVVPLRCGIFVQRAFDRDPGVVEADVEAAVELHGRFDEASHVVLDADVGADIFRLAAERLDFTFDLSPPVGPAAAECDFAALGREHLRCDCADAGGRAGDQNYLVLEPGTTVDHDLRSLLGADDCAGAGCSGRKTGDPRNGAGQQIAAVGDGFGSHWALLRYNCSLNIYEFEG